jgi:4a-hydroxytetrahydrobiopterin dehydratase
MSKFTEKSCVPCEGGVPPLSGNLLEEYSHDLGGSWSIINEHHLEKLFTFKNFAEALNFTNKVGQLAEAEKHHPDIHLSWGKVRVIIWTHSINGLSENDFILASKIDQIK